MASEKREVEKILKDEGFSLVRNGSRHPIYSDGTVTIVMPMGKIGSPRIRRWIKSQINQKRKALASEQAQS